MYSEINTLIIAPWGNPFTWSRVSYVLGNIIIENVVTSLTAVLKQYIDNLKSIRVLITVPETVMCPGSREDFINRYTSYGGKLLTEILTSEKFESGKDTWYEFYKDKLLVDIREVMYKFVEENVCQPLGIGKIECRRLIRVSIAPNIGVFKCGKQAVQWTLSNNIVAKGADISSYYGALLIIESILYFIKNISFKESGENNDLNDQFTVVLDITHGPNYMPLMAYRATSFITRLVAALTGINTRIILYNSEPHVASKILRIYKVEDETYTSNRAAQRLVYTYASTRRTLSADKIMIIDSSSEIGEKLKELKRSVKREFKLEKYISKHRKFIDGFASSIHYSLPLALISSEYWDRNAQELRQTLSNNDLRNLIEYLQEYLEFISKTFPITVLRSNSNGNAISVEHVAAIDYDLTKGVVSILGLKGYASNIYDMYRNEYIIRKENNTSRIYVGVPTLDKILDNLKGPHMLTSRKELDTIRSTTKDISRKKTSDIKDNECGNPLVKLIYRSYREGRLICSEEQTNATKELSDEKVRNFVAHAGLIADNICLEWVNGCIILGYNNMDVSLNLMQKSIKKLGDFLEKTKGF